MPYVVSAECNTSHSVIESAGVAAPALESELRRRDHYTLFRSQQIHKQSFLDNESTSPCRNRWDLMVPRPPTNMKPLLNSYSSPSTLQNPWPCMRQEVANGDHYVLAGCNNDEHTNSFLADTRTEQLKDPKWSVPNKSKAQKSLDSVFESCHNCWANYNWPSHHYHARNEVSYIVPSLQHGHATDTLAPFQSGQANTHSEGCRCHHLSHKRTLGNGPVSLQSLEVLNSNSNHTGHGFHPGPAKTMLKSLEPALTSKVEGLYWKAGNVDNKPLLHRIEAYENLEVTDRQPERVSDGSSSHEPWLEKAEDGISNKHQESRARESPDSGGASDGQTKRRQKRRLSSTRWEEDDFDDSGKDGDKPKAWKRPRREGSEVKRFACPFYKHNPQEYRSSRTCMGPGWTNIHRVKEHLLRRHRLSDSQCLRCFEEFVTESEYQDHLRQPTVCSIRARPPGKEGINRQQEARLKSRKKGSRPKTEKERWYEMYKIIFPDDASIPSPYYEPETSDSCVESNSLTDLRGFLMRELPKLVREQFTELIDDKLDQILQDLTPWGQQIETAVTAALQKALPETNGSLVQEGQTLPTTIPGVLSEAFPWDLDSSSFDRSPFDDNSFDSFASTDLLIPYLEPSSTWSADSADGSIDAVLAAEHIQRVNRAVSDASTINKMSNDG